MPRLAPIAEFPPGTRILVPSNLLPFQRDTLRWLGLEERCRPTSETDLIVENYYFSAPPSMIVCYSPYAVEFLRERLLSARTIALQTPKRFLVRRPGVVRNVINEDEVCQFFSKRGWPVVDCADLSLADQIQYFHNAEAICGIHGAGFTNSVWCQSGCKILELFPEGYINGCFEWIAEVVNAEHHYRVYPSDELFNARIDVQKLARFLGGVCLASDL